VYDEEAVREHARKIWFAVQSIIGMDEQFQFKHVSFTPYPLFLKGGEYNTDIHPPSEPST
jgi:hypothetical protein